MSSDSVCLSDTIMCVLWAYSHTGILTYLNHSRDVKNKRGPSELSQLSPKPGSDH